MKTAEEWYDENDATGRNSVVDLVKQIQLDAIKEGMRRAAGKIGAEDETNDCSACRRHLKDVEQAILSAAEQLTEKDL